MVFSIYITVILGIYQKTVKSIDDRSNKAMNSFFVKLPDKIFVEEFGFGLR